MSDGRTVLDNTLVFYSSDISDGEAYGSPITSFGEHGMAPLAGLTT